MAKYSEVKEELTQEQEKLPGHDTALKAKEAKATAPDDVCRAFQF